MSREDAEWTARAVKDYVDALRDADQRAIQLLAAGVHHRLNIVIAIVSIIAVIEGYFRLYH